MAMRSELLEASDEDIDDAVLHADAMVLRGVLYLLTNDETVANTEVTQQSIGFYDAKALTHPEDGPFLRSKAAEFLKSYRDQGAPDIPVTSEVLVRRSLALTAGDDIPERDMPLWLEELALDRWARGLEWPETPDPEKLKNFSALVIGTGMCGVNAAIQLKHAGIPYSVVEKNSDIGGTWFENRYPGARVDTPSRAYTLICGAGEYNYPYQYSPQAENEKYINWLADEHDIRRDIEFDTEVTSMTWDDEAKMWDVRGIGPEGQRSWRVNAVMTAVGLLSRPNIPEIEGADEFKGEMFHTARWPTGLDLTDKRVAVIGSGASAYQMFPEVSKVAAHAFLFQRTPSWLFEVANYLPPLPSQVNWLERNLPYYRNFFRFRGRWLHGPVIQGRLFNNDPEVTNPMREQRMNFLRSKLAGHSDILEKMTPQYPPAASRPVLVDPEYSVIDALLEDHTTLVTEGIAKITPNGIVDGAGREHAIDVIVLATGFKANEFLWPIDIRGKSGITLDQLWEKDGARAYLGALLPGFPNLFVIYGPNTNPVGGAGNPAIHELSERFVLACMAHLILKDKRTIEATQDAYERFNAEVDEAEPKKIYVNAGVRNYYTNEYGRSAVNSPFDARKTWEWLRDPTGEYARNANETINAGSLVRPYFGEDLVIE